jgi:hypothetical protein
MSRQQDGPAGRRGELPKASGCRSKRLRDSGPENCRGRPFAAFGQRVAGASSECVLSPSVARGGKRGGSREAAQGAKPPPARFSGKAQIEPAPRRRRTTTGAGSKKTRGPPGADADQGAADSAFSSEAGKVPPATAACACVTSAQVEDLIRRRSARRQDDDRSDRRGAADGAGVESKVTMQRREWGERTRRPPGLKF